MPQSKQQRPLGRLDGQTRLLLIVNALFGLANALSGTFVNVYLWRVKQDFAMIGWFSLSAQTAGILAFILAGKWVKERNKMNVLRAGIAFSAVFYMLVLLLGKQAARWVIPLGAVQGLSGAFYWLAYNVIYFEVTERDNRDKFNGWAGLIGSGIGMAAPWFSGFVITRMQGAAGYRLIFSISLGVFVFAAILSFFLNKRPVQPNFEWWYGLKQLQRRGSVWRSAFPALAAQGIREGVFGFLIGLMVYIATKNELQLGTYALITSAVSLFAYVAAGKWIRPERRSRMMFIGAVSMVLVILLFYWEVNYTALVIFGVVVAMAYPLFGIPITSTVFDLIGMTKESAEHRVELVILREAALSLGRIAGTAAFIAVVSMTTKPLHLVTLMLILGVSPVFSWLFLRGALSRPPDKEKRSVA